MFKQIILLTILSLILGTTYAAGGQQKFDFDPEQNQFDSQVFNELHNYLSYRVDGLEDFQVIKATRQVVNGLNYFLTIKVNSESDSQLYKAQIYLQPRENIVEIKEFKAIQKPKKQYRSDEFLQNEQLFTNVGSEENYTFDPENNPVDSLVQIYLQSLIKTQTQGKQDFSKVLQVKRQVVSGFNYFIKLQMKNEQGQTEEAQVTLYVVPWKNTVELTKFEKIASSNDTLQSVSEEFNSREAYKFSPEVNKLDSKVAKFIQTYIKKQYHGQYKFSKIVSASRQVVSGLLYNLTIQLKNKAGNNETMIATVYYVPWKNQLVVKSAEILKHTMPVIDDMLKSQQQQYHAPPE